MPETKPAEPLALDLLGKPVEAAVDEVVAYAIDRRASDLFLLSFENFVAIEVRHLGIIRRIGLVGADEGKRFIQHVKAQAGMDVANARIPADGRWIHEAPGGATVDLRINTIPTLYGEDVTLRLLARETGLFSLDALGMTDGQIDSFRNMLDSPSGLILCTGPTGSGKTATLYAALNKLNDGKRKINTIEDPIEFAVQGLRQSQVRTQLDLTFAKLLRSILRQSPDIIMIGEIRDAETAHTAVRAANSGHLVFTTLHAPVAAAAVQAMRSLEVHPHFLATGLRGVISQRLLRTLCPHCKVAFDIDHAPQMFDEVADLLGPDEGKQFFGPGKCDQCDHTGYAGRTGVYEIIDVNPGSRKLIAENAPTAKIRDQAIADGMVEFRKAAMLRVARGETSVEEVLRAIPREHLLIDE